MKLLVLSLINNYYKLKSIFNMIWLNILARFVITNSVNTSYCIFKINLKIFPINYLETMDYFYIK